MGAEEEWIQTMHISFISKKYIFWRAIDQPALSETTMSKPREGTLIPYVET